MNTLSQVQRAADVTPQSSMLLEWVDSHMTHIQDGNCVCVCMCVCVYSSAHKCEHACKDAPAHNQEIGLI